MAKRVTFIVLALCATVLSLRVLAGEFPDDWTFDDDAKLRASHAELEGKPMPKLDLSGWVNGEVKADDMKGKVVVVDFYATWCGPCKMMAPVIDEVAKDYAGKLKVVKIDVDEAAETAAAMGVTAMPTFIVLKDGQEVWRRLGAAPKAAFVNELQGVI